MVETGGPSREELKLELATVQSEMAELERERRPYKKLSFSTDMIENRLRPLRRRQEQLTASLDRLARRKQADERRWARVQHTPSTSN